MKKLAIGVDIGGINTAFGLVDENGDLYAESVISTKKYPYVDDYPAYVGTFATRCALWRRAFRSSTN